jgi:peptidyl-prolyl cis-trans isomerase SurA
VFGSWPILGRSTTIALVVAVLAVGIVGDLRAQGELRIAAIVNDEVISVFDLEARVKFAIASSGLPDTPETRERLKLQVLRGLIDERLRVQEAERLSIRVSESEVKRALGNIEQQNKLPQGGLDAFLTTRGIERFTLEAQIRATLAWQKLVRRRLRPRVEIGDDEVDEALAQIKANQGKPEMRVAEIFISVDSREQEDDVRQMAERLVEQLDNGARFSALARQFSQSASAAVGGDLGWIQQGQIDEVLDRALAQMRPDTFSDPIRTFGGYHILMLVDRRSILGASPAETKVRLSQIALPLRPNAPESDVAAQMSLAQSIGQKAATCPDFEALGKKTGSAVSGSLGELKVGDLPPNLSKIVLALEVNQVSEPIRTDAGLLVLMVCAREDPPSRLPEPEEIKEQLLLQRLDLLARRYMRDLRNQAFVDLRV